MLTLSVSGVFFLPAMRYGFSRVPNSPPVRLRGPHRTGISSARAACAVLSGKSQALKANDPDHDVRVLTVSFQPSGLRQNFRKLPPELPAARQPQTVTESHRLSSSRKRQGTVPFPGILPAGSAGKTT